jgi:hypothetical protein
MILRSLVSVFAGDQRFNLYYSDDTKVSRRLFFI